MNTKSIVLAIALIVMMLAAVAGTLALLSKKTDKLDNTFTANDMSCEVDITDFYGYPDGLKVKNTGDMDGYVRVTIVANWVIDNPDDPDNGGIYALQPKVNEDYSISTTERSNWTKIGNYYYANKVVLQGNKTEDLLLRIKQLKKKDGYKLKFTALAEIVQADPSTAVQNAWGVKKLDSSTSPAWEIIN